MFQTPFQFLQTDAALWSCVMFLGIGRDLDHRDRAGNVYCCLAVLPRVGNCTPGSLGLGELTSGDSVSQRQGGQAVAPICPVDAWTCAPRVSFRQ